MANAMQVGVVADRMPTEMETASERFGSALRRLRDMNGILQSRLDMFKPEPSTLAQNTSQLGSATQPEPTPGTAASLAHIGNAMHDELSRFDSLVVRIQSII